MGSYQISAHSRSTSWNAWIMRYIIVLILALLSVASPSDRKSDGSGCSGETCPFDSIYVGGVDRRNDVEVGCTLWMGPSPIKQAEDHGFGLGIFTGKVRKYFLKGGTELPLPRTKNSKSIIYCSKLHGIF